MENNEITMLMDLKLDIHNKRPDALKFKQWTRCEVKIEAVKCLPSYLRVTIEGCDEVGLIKKSAAQEQQEKEECVICVSIIVPGVNISLATSRTKEYSYGLFWTQTRKQCYIYFAMETETSCRRHMKWIKKSIKNLELYRQLLLEQNRISRGPSMGEGSIKKENKQLLCHQQKQKNENYLKGSYSTLGPLPKIPDCPNANQSDWCRRISHASGIYEEIVECFDGQPRLSRRVSHSSIASGIYEEMKPISSAFNVITEELSECRPGTSAGISHKPPLPPLPPPRKRINTYDGQGVLGEIPRSNTNPESELAKKKKYKNMLTNIFSSTRAKRAESVSETQACTAEDIINSITPTKSDKEKEVNMDIYVNDMPAKQYSKVRCQVSTIALTHISKRNSFSSPDLLEITNVDTVNDQGARGTLNNTFGHSDDLDLSSDSLSNVSVESPRKALPFSNPGVLSAENLNVSARIPNNFNFSAINTSSINLIGCNGAAIPASNQKKNNIYIDDVTGYCVMAPIRPKKYQRSGDGKLVTEPISSGYSTGTYPSTSSSSAEEPQVPAVTENPAIAAEDSAIYELMHASHVSSVEPNVASELDTIKNGEGVTTTTTTSPITANMIDFTGDLYENLLAVKASQEFEHQLPPVLLSTSTPTESPCTQQQVANQQQAISEEENYYQTPRKSIISVDDKIPSYYPNSCDTAKTRRNSPHVAPVSRVAGCNSLPIVDAPVASTVNAIEKTNTVSKSVGVRHVVSLKIHRDDSLYISSPQSIIEQPQSGYLPSDSGNKLTLKNGKTHRTMRSGALKIAEHVYTVRHGKQKSNGTVNNNNDNAAGFTGHIRERLQTELLQMAMLQNIDFKFDDADCTSEQYKPSEELRTSPRTAKLQQKSTQNERIYENLLHHHLQLRQTEKQMGVDGSPTSPAYVSSTKPKLEMHHSCIAGVTVGASVADSGIVEETGCCSTTSAAAVATGGLNSVKKFASLPRFKKIDFSPLRLKISNVLQRGQQHEF